MIFTPWYCFSSFFDDKQKDKKHFSSLVCKHEEFFYLWYLYVQHYCGPQKIYIVDCCSPVSLDKTLKYINKKVQFLEESSFNLNLEADIYIKRFNTELNHFYGSSRTHLDYLTCCWKNNISLKLIESDVLIGYNVLEDFKNCNFCTQIIRHHNTDTIFEGAICYVSAQEIQQKFNEGTMNHWIFGNKNEQIFHEGEMYKLFCRGVTKELSNKNGYVHKCGPEELYAFLKATDFKNNYINYYKNLLIKYSL